MNENREHCKAIAERLEAVIGGNIYRCPECGEWIEFDNEQYNGDTAEYTCQECSATFDESDLEAVILYDYFADILDMEYRCGSDREYRSCKIMVACGGPNIYIDTASALVKLYWWAEYAEYPLSYEARDAIDEWAEEYWNI